MTSLKAFIEAGWNRTSVVKKQFFCINRRYIEKRVLFKKACILFLLGMLYGILISHTGFSIPCPFRYFTGFLCPGCGITTLFLSLVHGDWNNAEQANAFLFYTLPLLFLSLVIVFIWPNSQVARLNKKYFMPLFLVALVVFGFYRNIIW